MFDPTNSTASGRPRAGVPNVGVATTFSPPPSTMDEDDIDHPGPPSGGGEATTLDTPGVTIGQIHGGTPGYAPQGISDPTSGVDWEMPLTSWAEAEKENIGWVEAYTKEQERKNAAYVKWLNKKSPRFPLPSDLDTSWAGTAIGILGAAWSDIGGNPWDLTRRKDML